MNKRNASYVMLSITAMIWGFTFVAQRVGGDILGTFGFNGMRFALGAISLVPVILIFDRKKMSREKRKKTIAYGVLCGAVLYIAAMLQQYGIKLTHSAGKAGFITGLYIVIVPILTFLFYRQKQGIKVIMGAILCVVGMFLMSVNEAFRMELGDVVLLIGSVFWALHIILIDRCVSIVSALKLAIIQFSVCAGLNLITAAFYGGVHFDDVVSAWLPLLFGGVGSVGIAYTLQVIAQKNADPAIAAIILSTESIFGAVGGFIFLNERLGVKGNIGGLLIFAGVIISQIKFKKKYKTDKVEDNSELLKIENSETK